jgi:hypothetical protein
MSQGTTIHLLPSGRVHIHIDGDLHLHVSAGQALSALKPVPAAEVLDATPAPAVEARGAPPAPVASEPAAPSAPASALAALAPAASAPAASAPAASAPAASAPAPAAARAAASATEPRYFEDMDPTQGWTPVLDIASDDPAVIDRGHGPWLRFLSLLLDDEGYVEWCRVSGINRSLLSSPTDRIALFQVFGSGTYAQSICSYVKACGGLTHAVARHLQMPNATERAQEALQIAGRIVQISSVAWDTLGHYMEWPLVNYTPEQLTQRLAPIMES